MQISKEMKVQLFDLALWYFLPLLAVNLLANFLGGVIDISWLPSEKDNSALYMICGQAVYTMRLVGGVFAFYLYLEYGHPPFNKRPRKESILIGLGFSAALTAFFFGLTWAQPGFTQVPGSGWMFVWEVLLFRYLPLFMGYGVALQILLHDRHEIWLHVGVAIALQFMWSLGSQAFLWSQGGYVFDPHSLYPMTSVILAIALSKKFGVYAAVAALFVNALAYQSILLFEKFPIPSHVNSLLTLACLLFLIRLIQNLQLRPELLQAIHSRSAATESAPPTPG